MAKKSNGVLKVFLCIICAAAIGGGGFYAGYTKHSSNISSAIPKQTTSTPEALPALNQAQQDAPKETPDAGKYIGKSESSPIEQTWSEVDTFKCDLNNDGERDTIKLSTSAESDNGEILWNDSQKWVLEVKIGNDYYILLNQNVSNGRIYYDISETSDGAYAITVYTVLGTGTSVKQYTYSKTGFVEKLLYTAPAGNMLHSSVPAYE